MLFRRLYIYIYIYSPSAVTSQGMNCSHNDRHSVSEFKYARQGSHFKVKLKREKEIVEERALGRGN